MAATKPLFSYEDLAHTPDDGKRYEINDGELIVSPAPTFGHQRVGWKLSGLLMRAEEAGYGQGVAAPVDVVFGRHKTTQPDLLFIRRERLGIVAGGKVHGAPDLIVEILSPGSRDDDLGWKKTLYAREGVLYYWVADPQGQTVQPYTLRDGGYVAGPLLHAGDELGCPLFPGITIEVARIFA
jgi:Uma2 family endonuclease